MTRRQSHKRTRETRTIYQWKAWTALRREVLARDQYQCRIKREHCQVKATEVDLRRAPPHRHDVGIGVEGRLFPDAWAPLFFFALLFGLSMDYQLFLVAAIRERYEATANTQLAIRDGIARTGRPITNAALITIVVFIAFGVTGLIPPNRARLDPRPRRTPRRQRLRMMLVPSLVKLLGERNWWIPAWPDKRLRRIHFSH